MKKFRVSEKAREFYKEPPQKFVLNERVKTRKWENNKFKGIHNRFTGTGIVIGIEQVTGSSFPTYLVQFEKGKTYVTGHNLEKEFITVHMIVDIEE